VALAELLLGAGADPLARFSAPNGRFEYQPIHVAAKWSARLVQRLVAAGASIDGDVVGNSTLLSAARAGTARCMRMIPALVALGARETVGNDAMHEFADEFAESSAIGAQPSDEEVRAALAALVSVGCSLTEPAANGFTPMDRAASRGSTPVVRALLALGAAATTKSLAHAVKHPGIVRALLAAGAPAVGLVRVSAHTATPLMRAALAVSQESVRLLLDAGASVNHRNERSDTALIYALRGNDEYESRSEATLAAVPGVVEVLLNGGSDVAARDRAGNTPLHVLARYCATQPWAGAVAQLLLGSGADASVVNKEGETPAACVPDADDEFLELDDESAAACDALAELLLAAETAE
jgi:ankyrin repeat protein